MADQKISQLLALDGASVDTAADLLAIVDTSAVATKSITVAALLGLASGVPVGTRANRPAADAATLYVAWDTGEFFASDGTSWSYIEGAKNTSCIVNRLTTGYELTSAFNTVSLTNVVSDPGANYNSATYIYTAPVTGVYQVVTKLRVADASTAGVSYAQGAGTTNADGPHMLWSLSNNSRNGSINVRTLALAAGEQLRMYTYADSTLGTEAAEMNITLVSL